jgi:hypothetical protein
MYNTNFLIQGTTLAFAWVLRTTMTQIRLFRLQAKVWTGDLLNTKHKL